VPKYEDGENAVNKGYTLLETLVVLAVVAVLTGIGGPALLSALPGAEMDRATRTIVSMCRHARFEAIKRNEQIRLQCDMQSNTCEIRVRGDNTLLRRFDLNGLRNNVIHTKSFTTHFNGLGRATVAGTVTFENNTGLSRSVTVRTSGSVVTKDAD
jgi:prepilin-type N-terminal cleavage/methylation domain-containing protein